MIGSRIEVTADFRVLSPLRVGAGEAVALAHLTSGENGPNRLRKITDKNGDAVEVAAVLLDACGLPYLPGSTLKGVFRAIGASAGLAVERLFGKEGLAKNEAPRSGKLVFWSARSIHVPDTAHLPHAGLVFSDPLEADGDLADERRTLGSVGLFVDTRTAIDPSRGVAAAHRLHSAVYVAPDVVFRFRAALFDSTLADATMELLSHAAAPSGVRIGAGGGYGQGAIRLESKTITVVRRETGSDGALAREDISSEWRPKLGERQSLARRELILRCDGPFMVLDSSVERKLGEGEPLSPLRDADGRPRLPGSTLHGALRARATWLARLKQPTMRDSRDLVLRLDTGSSAADLGPEREVCHSVADLTPVERLFGVNGWRGLVRLGPVRCESFSDWKNITSVKIDLFSGGPFDGDLYTVRAALDPCFETDIRLESRGGYPLPVDRALFDDLLADLSSSGLILGHGGTSGYGWFGIEVRRHG